MKKLIILLLFVLFPIFLFGWTSMYLKGEFNSWSNVAMLESVDHLQHWFWPYRASSTDAQMEFIFSGDNTTYDATHKYGDNDPPGHVADLNGTSNCYIATSGCQTSGESYIIIFVTDGSSDDLKYDQSHIISFKIEGSSPIGWGIDAAKLMTEVSSSSGDFWKYTFNVTSTGNHYFRLWPNSVEANWGTNWEFAPANDTEISLDVQTTVTIGNYDGNGAYYFNATSTGDYTISVRPHDRIVLAEKGSNSTLPVELSTFTAQYLAGKPLLYWTTQSETDNMGWFVYRNQVEDFTSATKVSRMIEGHGTTTQAQSYIYEDVIANPQVGDVYYYWLESIDYSGTIHHFDKVAMITIPETNDPNPNVTPPQVYDLLASPNPFNETTNIEFMLTQTAMVDVAIYDVKGGLVKSFDTQHVTAEVPVSLQWDGKDENGKSLSNGIYLYSLKVNGQDYATKQVILMK